MTEKIGGGIVVLLLVSAFVYFIWGIGYQGPSSIASGESVENESTVVREGKEFRVSLPKSENQEQVWMLIRGNDRVENLGINRDGKDEVWTFMAVRKGNAPLEFVWSILDRGVWPSDERRVFNLEVR